MRFPVSRKEKTELGPVIYDADKCMGCRYCMTACPFDVPKYEWDSAIPAVRKCDMERQTSSENIPASNAANLNFVAVAVTVSIPLRQQFSLPASKKVT